MSLVFARGSASLSAALGCHGYLLRAPAAAAWRRRRLPHARYLATEETNKPLGQPEKKEDYQQSKSIIFSDQQGARQSYANLTPAQKVVERGKDAGYALVVVAGALITGGLFYVLGRELFSSQAPSALHSLALERCLSDAQVQSALGEPIRSHGEGSSRRSRSRVLTSESVDANGLKLVTMKFYLDGQFNKAEVYCQGYMTPEKTWKIKYLIVEVQRYPKRVIILERDESSTPAPPAPLFPAGSAKA